MPPQGGESPCQGEFGGFDSRHLVYMYEWRNLVAQWLYKPLVVGSIPISCTGSSSSGKTVDFESMNRGPIPLLPTVVTVDACFNLSRDHLKALEILILRHGRSVEKD